MEVAQDRVLWWTFKLPMFNLRVELPESSLFVYMTC